MSQYNFNLALPTKNFDIQIDEEACYGYFEHMHYGDECGGGLWFDKTENGDLQLSDYDGVFSLPREVCDALSLHGFVVDSIYYPD